jgi:DNA helicase-2/ATP-dependent DNA helicase PcrA
MTVQRFPSSMSGRRQEWLISEEEFPADKRQRYEGSDPDERRLFYVALTRARDGAYVSSFQRISRNVGLSPYLAETADNLGVSQIPAVNELPSPGGPEILKDPEREPLELGFSDLADYEDCGYKYRLGRVFGFQPELVPELGYGRAAHHVLRLLAEQASAAGKVPEDDEVAKLVKDELYVPFANESTYANMLRSIHRLVHCYVTDWPEDLQRIWAVERPFEIHLGDGILSGRADIILDEENGHIGHLAIVDYKTATDEHRNERYDQQLRVYAAAGLQEGLDVQACFVHELKTSGRKPVTIEPEILDSTVKWATERVREIAGGTYLERPEKIKCKRCDFSLVCRHNYAPQ